MSLDDEFRMSPPKPSLLARHSRNDLVGMRIIDDFIDKVECW